MTDTIFGHSWEEIQAMQRGEPSPRVFRRDSAEEASEKLLNDVRRFKIDVAAEVVDAYDLSLPEGYSLCDDGFYRYAGEEEG